MNNKTNRLLFFLASVIFLDISGSVASKKRESKENGKQKRVAALKTNAKGKEQDTADLQEKGWIQKALVLLGIIEEYAKKGTVSPVDQKTYIKTLQEIEDQINALNPALVDVEKYNDLYVNPYVEWQNYIVQIKVEESKETPKEAQIKANTVKRQAIYALAGREIQKSGEVFSDTVQTLVEGLGDFSSAAVQTFYASLDDAVSAFKTSMVSVKKQAMHTYFSYLQLHGEAIDLHQLTPDQHELVQSIGVMIDRATLHVESVALDLTTKMSSKTFERQTADAFEQYEHDAEVTYEDVLRANQALADRDWFDNLKDSGSRILKNFGSKMQEAVQKQAEDEIHKALEEQGAQLANAIGQKAGEIGGKALNQIKDKASEIGGPAFEALKERATSIGGETLQKFADKAKALGGDVTNIVKNKIVEEVDKQVANQIGIDATSLVKLLAGKDVDPIELQKTIKNKFPVLRTEAEIKAVTVKERNDLCPQEKSYIVNRLARVEETLKESFDINKPLRLGFSCSGGGNRAMIGTLGMLIAAARHKFLDISMYLTGLSGSTWTIAPWSFMYLKGLLSQDIEESLVEFKEMLISQLDYACPAQGAPCPPNALSADVLLPFSQNIAKHFGYGQPITAVDIWGAHIANYALKKVGSSRLTVAWSSIAKEAEEGSIPLPLCSSLLDLKDGENEKTGYHTEYKWFESGPFEVGTPLLGFIPVWALGSTFKDGKIVSAAPEYELSEFLGVYGSAFAVSMNDLIDKGLPLPSFKVLGVEIKLPVDTWVRNIIDGVQADVRAKRIDEIHARFANYSKGLATSALKDSDVFGMFDGGIYFNIPLPLLFDRSERAVDVAIIYDSNPADLQSLVDASRYFAKVDPSVPSMEIDPITKNAVTTAGLLSRPMTVFNDPRHEKTYNKSQSTLIYFPTPKTDIAKAPYSIDTKNYPDINAPINNSDIPYTTANFKYTKSELENLAQTMEAIFESQVCEMKEVLQLVAKNRLGAAVARVTCPPLPGGKATAPEENSYDVDSDAEAGDSLEDDN